MGGVDNNSQRRRLLWRRVRSMGLPCAICGDPIDYGAPHMDPRSFTLDEVVPRSLGGSGVDPDNVQPAHRLCNTLKGNRMNVRFHGFADALAFRDDRTRGKSRLRFGSDGTPEEVPRGPTFAHTPGSRM